MRHTGMWLACTAPNLWWIGLLTLHFAFLTRYCPTEVMQEPSWQH